jgi:hypothetical protein
VVKIWKVILAVIVIYGAGVITGGLTVRTRIPAQRTAEVQNPGPIPFAPHQRIEFLRRMQRHVDLNPEQHRRIEGILTESQKRMKELWEPVAPEANEELTRVRNEIFAELRQDQQKKFEEAFKPRVRRPNEGKRGPGPGDHELVRAKRLERNPTNSKAGSPRDSSRID